MMHDGLHFLTVTESTASYEKVVLMGDRVVTWTREGRSFERVRARHSGLFRDRVRGRDGHMWESGAWDQGRQSGCHEPEGDGRQLTVNGQSDRCMMKISIKL